MSAMNEGALFTRPAAEIARLGRGGMIIGAVGLALAAIGFATVKAFGTNGGTNQRDVIDSLTFVLEYEGTWQEI